MEQISIYLEKFKKFGFKDVQIKELVVETIFELFNVVVERKNIKIENGKILIMVSGPLKSEIFINRTKVVETIKEKTKIKLATKTSQIKEVR